LFHLRQLKITGLRALALYSEVKRLSSWDRRAWQPLPLMGKSLLATWPHLTYSNWNLFCCSSCACLSLGDSDLQEDDDGLLNHQQLCRVTPPVSCRTVSRSLDFYLKAVIPFC